LIDTSGNTASLVTWITIFIIDYLLKPDFRRDLPRIFISNDQIPKIEHFKMPRKVKADLLKEEAMIDQFHYNTRNLDAIDLESITTLHQKLMAPAPEAVATKKTARKTEKESV
jgi:hypothetical protein